MYVLHSFVISLFLVVAAQAQTATGEIVAIAGDLDENKNQILYIYSPIPLQAPALRVGIDGDWVRLKSYKSKDDSFAYGTSRGFPLEKGTELVVRARVLGKVQFNTTAEISNTDAIPLSIAVRSSAERLPALLEGEELSQKVLFYGSPNVDPNELAQAQAEYISKNGGMSPLGNGTVKTTEGEFRVLVSRGTFDEYPAIHPGRTMALGIATDRSGLKTGVRFIPLNSPRN